MTYVSCVFQSEKMFSFKNIYIIIHIFLKHKKFASKNNNESSNLELVLHKCKIVVRCNIAQKRESFYMF